MENYIDCELEALDKGWELPRTNACHIGVMNDEMGVLADSQLGIEASLGTIGGKMDILFGVFGIVATAIIILVVKKIFGNNK